jgi:hypothetical protein
VLLNECVAKGLSERDRERAEGTEAIMRNRLYIALLMLACSLGQAGCIVPIWSSSADVRARQLIYQSENYRHIPEIWERVWFLDTPDFNTPYRTHGGVI